MIAKNMKKIPFNKLPISQKEITNLLDCMKKDKLSGDGYYTKFCNEWFLKNYGRKALLTHSCTAALEMSAILLDANIGDEVIMPSYTFVSTANAFVLRGLKPVFVDIRPDTININEKLIEEAITERTKAIVPVHYAGVSCEMDTILSIAKKHNLKVIEDSAQGVMSEYKGKKLGTIGDLGTLSFHETKNIISGEGGALIINNSDYLERCEIIREKGTNRSKFFRGEVDKYTWVDIGSSYLPSDMIAAFLYAQLQRATEITNKRLSVWDKYNNYFKEYEKKGIIRCPVVPKDCKHNAHMYYILFNDIETRSAYIDYLKSNEIYSTFHYVPLHSSPMGNKYCRYVGNMEVTNKISDTLLRLPMFYDLNDEDLERIFENTDKFMRGK